MAASPWGLVKRARATLPSGRVMPLEYEAISVPSLETFTPVSSPRGVTVLGQVRNCELGPNWVTLLRSSATGKGPG